MLVDDRECAGRDPRTIFRATKWRAGHHAIDPEPEERHGFVDGHRQRVGVGEREITRVLAIGKPGHRHLDLVLLFPFVELLGGTLTGRIGVEGQHNAAGEPLENAHVLFGESRATRGHRAGHAGPMETDDVGVALAHHDLVVLHHVGLGPVESVESLRLEVHLGLG